MTMTTSRVKCARCGYDNELNRLFCLRCGGKLDLTRVTTQDLAQPSSWGLWKLVRLVISLVALAGLFLILWPVEPQGTRGIKADASQLANKIRDLDNAVDTGKSMSILVSEAEANAYLADAVERSQKNVEPAWYLLRLRDINLTFTPSRFIVLIAADWGPLRLTYELRGEIARGPRFAVIESRWGHLSLFGIGNVWLVRNMAGVFSGMGRESDLLKRLGRIELERGYTRLWTRSGKTS